MIFNFQEIGQLAELLLKYPMIYATSKFDVGKVNSPLHLPLKPDSNYDNYHNRSHENSKNQNSNCSNRQRNYPQSLHGNIT